MKWPWVSRLAFDLMVSERDAAEKRVAGMAERAELDAMTRARDWLLSEREKLVEKVTFDILLAERDRLAAQNDTLVDHLKRVQRTEIGLSEQIRVPKPKEEDDTPPELWELARGFESKRMQQQVMDDARAARRAGHTWDSIIKTLAMDLLGDDDETESETD